MLLAKPRLRQKSAEATKLAVRLPVPFVPTLAAPSKHLQLWWHVTTWQSAAACLLGPALTVPTVVDFSGFSEELAAQTSGITVPQALDSNAAETEVGDTKHDDALHQESVTGPPLLRRNPAVGE